MNFVFLQALVVVLAGAHPTIAANLAAEVQNAVAEVRSPDTFGTAFVVGFDQHTFLVTAKHVATAERLEVRFAADPHQRYLAELVRTDPNLDVAVLKVAGYVQGVVRVMFDERLVEPSDPLDAIGFPGDALRPNFSRGGAATVDGSAIVVDKSIPSGFSGGPLLRAGWVVGLLIESSADQSYALPAAMLRQILGSWHTPHNSGSSARSLPTAEADDSEDLDTWTPPPTFKFQAPAPVQPCVSRVHSPTGANLPVNVLPLRSAGARTSLPPGTPVEVLGRQEGDGYVWLRIRNGQVEGWMRNDQVAQCH